MSQVDRIKNQVGFALRGSWGHQSRWPPDVANYLSCHEARNHCGGVVSLIPIVLDMMKEWVAHSEKLPRKALQHEATVKNKKRSATSLPGLVSWDLSLKENDIHPKTPEDAGQ
ncbi:sperm acrosome-associated protein 9 isoform X1 [Sagmatias obliquidens]|uniref:sperm acrosome-associated protein 9 isoform X1 n=1 Tax=Sagmatias obliquidens TaxID=3371155 RepID=UPI000F443332|nr:sperm acrosome-associated protein 9 isoform X1 [Lagenorhynchus obliquidens]